MSPVRLIVPTKWVRLVCLVAFFAIVLFTIPVHRDATAQGSRPRRTQGPPSRNLPNLDTADVRSLQAPTRSTCTISNSRRQCFNAPIHCKSVV
jgi:hypothetical protein